MVETPSAAKIPKTMDTWIVLGCMLMPEGEGGAHPSGPIPGIESGSGLVVAVFLKLPKNDREDGGFVFNVGVVKNGFGCCEGKKLDAT